MGRYLCCSNVRPARDPRETIEFGLVARGELGVHRRERGLLAGELLVEVAGICRSVLKGGGVLESSVCSDVRDTYDCGEVRRRNALVQHIVEIDVFEEGMSLDLLRVAFRGAKPPRRVAR